MTFVLMWVQFNKDEEKKQCDCVCYGNITGNTTDMQNIIVVNKLKAEL